MLSLLVGAADGLVAVLWASALWMRWVCLVACWLMGSHCQMTRVAIAPKPRTPIVLRSAFPHPPRRFLAAIGSDDCLLAAGISLLDGVLTDTTLIELRLGLVGRGLLSKLTRLMGYEFASIQRKLCSNLQSFG